MRSPSSAADVSQRDAAAAPWSLFERHNGRPWSFFLDRCGQASFAGSHPRSQLVVLATGRVRLWQERRWRDCDAHAIDAIADYVENNAAPLRSTARQLVPSDGVPRTVGYFAYEFGSFIESVPVAGADPSGLPLAVLSTYDHVDVWTPTSPTIERLVFEGAGDRAQEPPPACANPPLNPVSDEREARHRYELGFKRMLEAIRAGDIYQANLSRCIDLPFDDDPAAAYRRLRDRQPVPHGAFLDLGNRQILSNSPECFLSVRGDVVETRPIKGTRARRTQPLADRTAAEELAGDAKEIAEHVMIVDLERSDLGRVCRTGSVEVARYAEVQSYATVHHLVSTVRGRLRADVGVAALLRATFPGGSITGAPKVRAMEIIAAIEPQARGLYTGAIGCWNGGRAVDLSVAIRTAIVGRGRIRYNTGGAIVADSRLDAEYDETTVKARAFMESAVRVLPTTRAAI